MLRRILLAALCAVATASAGCGTILNEKGAWRTPSEPYGGVEFDWYEMRWGCGRLAKEQTEVVPWVVLTLAIIDLPLSAVGDTVMLPYDSLVMLVRHLKPADADMSPADQDK